VASFFSKTTAVAAMSRWNVVAVYSYYWPRGGRLAVGFRHVYMAIALQVGETRLHNNAPGPISSLWDWIGRRRNAIVARLAAHTYTHTGARALHEHTTHERALHATRTGTGGGPTHYWRARTLYDDGDDNDNGGDQTRINSENYFNNKLRLFINIIKIT